MSTRKDTPETANTPPKDAKYAIEVEHEGRTFTAYLKQPSFSELAFCTDMIQSGQTTMAGQRLLKNSWLEGDDALKDEANEQLHHAACLQAVNIIGSLPTARFRKL